MKTIKNMKPLSLLCVGYPGLCGAQFVDCASVLHVQPHHHLCGWYKMPWLVQACPPYHAEPDIFQCQTQRFWPGQEVYWEARRISNEFTVWVKDAGLVEAGVYFFLSCLSFEHHISDVEFRPWIQLNNN